LYHESRGGVRHARTRRHAEHDQTVAAKGPARKLGVTGGSSMTKKDLAKAIARKQS
jgi:hypothetical protein